jgi:hypothetical protein
MLVWRSPNIKTLKRGGSAHRDKQNPGDRHPPLFSCIQEHDFPPTSLLATQNRQLSKQKIHIDQAGGGGKVDCGKQPPATTTKTKTKTKTKTTTTTTKI